MHSYDIEANHHHLNHSLHDLAEDDDDDDYDDSGSSSNQKRTSFDDGTGRRVVTTMNGNAEASSFGPPRRNRTTETVDASQGKGFDGKKDGKSKSKR